MKKSTRAADTKKAEDERRARRAQEEVILRERRAEDEVRKKREEMKREVFESLELQLVRAGEEVCVRVCLALSRLSTGRERGLLRLIRVLESDNVLPFTPQSLKRKAKEEEKRAEEEAGEAARELAWEAMQSEVQRAEERHARNVAHRLAVEAEVRRRGEIRAEAKLDPVRSRRETKLVETAEHLALEDFRREVLKGLEKKGVDAKLLGPLKTFKL